MHLSLRSALAALLVCSIIVAVAAPAGSLPFKKRTKAAPSASTQQALQRAARSTSPRFGEALNDLDSASRQAFDVGQEEFIAVETVEGGLGPIFNDNSCAACHTAGGIGGASEITVTRFGRRMTDGRFDELASLGGSLLQAQAIHPDALEVVPAEANVVAKRITTPLFGAGLVEAISDETIERNAQRRQPDGVSGRVSYIVDPASGQTRVGRFGWKAQQATLLAFAGNAYLNEMGVTNRLFPTENDGRTDLLQRFDLVPDIEDTTNPATGLGDIDHLANFMRFLAPPPPVRRDHMALSGERVFAKAQCIACHTPMMYTAANPVAALSNKLVPLYSDLLLHDMGRLGDGIAQDDAKPNEMRTAPLWGLRARTKLLHDGRASTVADAIEAHDGEGAASRNLYRQLTPTEKRDLLTFLSTI
jgi:CxxC motif-containing protein (DUF1111 family)